MSINVPPWWLSSSTPLRSALVGSQQGLVHWISRQPPGPQARGAVSQPRRPILDCTPPDLIKGSNRTTSASQMRPEAIRHPDSLLDPLIWLILCGCVGECVCFCMCVLWCAFRLTSLGSFHRCTIRAKYVNSGLYDMFLMTRSENSIKGWGFTETSWWHRGCRLAKDSQDGPLDAFPLDFLPNSRWIWRKKSMLKVKKHRTKKQSNNLLKGYITCQSDHFKSQHAFLLAFLTYSIKGPAKQLIMQVRTSNSKISYFR